MALNQQTINVGPAPNDGLGDPIRTAFQKTNNNFSQLYSIPQVTPPPTLQGSVGDFAGMYAYDSTYFYYCFANYTGNSAIWAQLTQVGNVSVSALNDGNSNVRINGAGGNVIFAINGVDNKAILTPNGLSVSGIVSATGNVRGGNLNTTGDVSAGGNVFGTYIFGNGSQLTGLPATYSNANVAAYLPTYSGNITAAVISAAGNITGNYILGNGSLLTGLAPAYSNANVAAYLPTYSGNISAGNISTGNITTGNTTATGASQAGSYSTSGNVVGNNINSAGVVSATGNIITAGYFVGNFAGNITGNLVVPGSNTQVLFNTNGNADAVGGMTYNKGTNTFIVLGTVSSQGNTIGGNIVTSGQVSATGNITGNYILGNGSQLTGLPATYGNANVAAYLPTYTGNISAGNITATGASQAGSYSTAGNITGNYILGNGSQLTGLAPAYSNANVAAYLPVYSGNIAGGNISVTGSVQSGSYSASGNVTGGNITTTGLISGTGNITGGNILTPGQVSAAGGLNTGTTIIATGNIRGGNIISNGLVTAPGNITGGNILTAGIVSATGNIAGAYISAGNDINAGGNVSANAYTGITVSVTGNVTGNYILGNGSQLTGLPASYGNSNVATLLANFGSNTISTTGNISTGNLTDTGTLTVTGNITGGNVLTGGLISAVGNITGNFFIGNGSQLTGVVATGIGTLASLSVSGNITTGNLINNGFESVVGNITGGNLSVSTGTVTVGNIVNSNAGNAVGNIGSSSNYFNTVFAQATTALYADLAECYLADAEYAPGTVLSFGGSAEVTVSVQDHDPLIAGVVSTNPAHLMNSGLTGSHVVTVALAGRVPCQVQGPVTAGAMMVSAGNGRARAETNPDMGTVLGKAVQAFDGDTGTIEIVIGRL